MDAKDFITDIEIGMRGLQEFEVQVTIPDNFVFYGTVPYYMHIINKTALVTVPASSVQEARDLALAYFAGGVDPDE
jgi:hypothetical protein